MYDLKAMTILGAKVVYGDLTLVLTGNSSLNIFNKYEISSGGIEDLVGKSILSAVKIEKTFVISFEDGGFIKVGLDESDYQGPEAMVFQGSGMIQVWS